jgi:hypothetical protein
MRRELVDRAVVTAAQIDLTKTGVGGSPFVGDMSSTGIDVPAFPTTEPNRRYLFRLCAVGVPDRAVCKIHNLRQLLYIGFDQPVEEGQEDEQWRVEIPVTDPLWCFPDGNVSWHLRTVNTFRPDTTIIRPDLGTMTGTSGRGDTTDAALLCFRLPLAPGNYRPLNDGMPYGRAIGGLGSFRDMRYPWSNRGTSLGLEVAGPCTIALYGSVYQTDPDRRPNAPVIAEAGLRNEDLFVFNNPQARYTRIGARMDVELISR